MALPIPDFSQSFSRGLPYDQFLNRHAAPEDQPRWAAALAAVQLNETQRQLLASFTRQVNLLCLAAAWCGDCVDQCPILYRFCEASPRVELRLVDRDADPELAAALRLLGSPRVPQVVFLSEDFEFLSRFGDRTLARYRAIAASQAGASCAAGIVSSNDPVHQQVLQQWLDELERVHLILRTSPKLRQRHGD